MAVLTSQFFLSDEKGEMDMPSYINGDRASLQQEVDFDSLHRCSQKMKHALSAGPAVDRWDWGRIIEFIKWFCMLLDIPKLADSNGLRDLDRKYKLELCGMMVQSNVQTPGSGPEVASYPRLEISRTETTCSEYCPYIKGISDRTCLDYSITTS